MAVSSAVTERIDPLWFKDAIIYELHIKAFQDSNGDGIGDFNGLISRLDYLQDLGVTAIWLLPFYPSPQRDGGYDISDYYSINRDYGTVKQFKRFLKKAHKRGLKVITELVMNHTSDQHPWFQRARRAAPGSKYRDYYVWSDSPEKYSDTRIIFQDFESSNWTWDPVAKAYYWHRFYSHQPDLNYDHPEVQEEVFKILDFWLDMGVDGFRLDAIPYLFEREGTNCENLPETHVYLKKLRAHVEERHPHALFLAEANMWPEDAAAYFGDGDECHMNYHFPIMPRLFMSLKMEDRYPIIDIIDQTPEIPENCQWALFLRNHDELTLEMVTDEERDYMYRAYNKNPLSKINLGIRHRLAQLLDNNRQKIELMHTLLFSLPGTPVLYYGDEIGMGDNVHLGDRDGVRTPMQWSIDRNAGFSQANPQTLFLPLIMDPEYSYETINVETQQHNTSSLLWWTKRLIATRKRYQAFGRGGIRFLSPSNNKVLAFIRDFEEQTLLVVANLSRFSQATEIDLGEFAGNKVVEVFSQTSFPEIGAQPYQFTLGPHGYYWLQLQRHPVEEAGLEGLPPVKLQAGRWEEVFKHQAAAKLAGQILPHFLGRSRWFKPSYHRISEVKLGEVKLMSFDDRPGALLFLHVSLTQGLPEWYFLPLTFRPEDTEWLEQLPEEATLCELTLAGEKGYLYDATNDPQFRAYLFRQMISRKWRKGETTNGLVSELNRKHLKQLKAFRDQPRFSSKLIMAEDPRNSIIYGNDFRLKLYRKLDPAANPDVEINTYFTESTDFKQIPFMGGSLSYQTREGDTFMLGLLQEELPHKGSGRILFGEAVSRYLERVLEAPREVQRGKVKSDLRRGESLEKLPDWFASLIGGVQLERAELLGQTVANMHLALTAHPEVPGFEPEAFSLHYQRSLLSTLQSQHRKSHQALERKRAQLAPAVQPVVDQLLQGKTILTQQLKRIVGQKLETSKVRIHGNLHLGAVLFDGRDFSVVNFGGPKERTFSENRLKRSPLNDLAGLLRSLHETAYQDLFADGRFRGEDKNLLMSWAEVWYQTMGGFMLRAYLAKVNDASFLPADPAQRLMLLETFLLQRSLIELETTLAEDPERAVVPIMSLYATLKEVLEAEPPA